MSSTTCNVTGPAATDPASLGFKNEPFALQSNKYLTFVYPTMQTDGSEPEIQIGADDQHGIVVTSFNGKDFDTKAPRHEQRKLHVTLDDDYAVLQYHRRTSEAGGQAAQSRVVSGPEEYHRRRH